MFIFFQSARGHRKWCWCSNIQWSWFVYCPASIVFVLFRSSKSGFGLCLFACNPVRINMFTFWFRCPKKTNETCTFHLSWHHPWGAWDFCDCSPPRNGHEKSRGGGTWHRFVWGIPFDAVWIPKRSWHQRSPWKWMIGRWNLLSERPVFIYFQGRTVSFREGIKKKICDNAATLTIFWECFCRTTIIV